MRPVSTRPKIGIGLERRHQHAEQPILDDRRRDVLHHQIEQGRHRILRAFRLHRHPALLGGAVEDREVELFVGRIEGCEKIEDLVDDFDMALVRPVDLVDDDDRLEADLQGLAEHEFGLRHRAFGGIDEKYGTVDHVEDALDLAAEIGMARRVDDVDAGILPDQRGHLGEDGDAALALEIVRIHGALGNLLIVAEGAGLGEEPVDHGGLAVIDMGNDGYVAEFHKLGGALEIKGFGGWRGV